MRKITNGFISVCIYPNNSMIVFEGTNFQKMNVGNKSNFFTANFDGFGAITFNELDKVVSVYLQNPRDVHLLGGGESPQNNWKVEIKGML